jgi:hypothetical protein
LENLNSNKNISLDEKNIILLDLIKSRNHADEIKDMSNCIDLLKEPEDINASTYLFRKKGKRFLKVKRRRMPKSIDLTYDLGNSASVDLTQFELFENTMSSNTSFEDKTLLLNSGLKIDKKYSINSINSKRASIYFRRKFFFEEKNEKSGIIIQPKNRRKIKNNINSSCSRKFMQ